VKAMKRIGDRLVTIFGMVIVSTSLSYGQMNVGSIVGTITDPTGAVVPSAKIILVNQGTQVTQETQTNASGFYTFKALPVGRYKLSVTLSGFQTYERPDIQIVSGETVTLDVKLVVGQETQTITITGEAPLLDTATANSGTTRTEGEIEALPITLYGNSSRAASALAKTMAGVSYEPSESGGQEFMIISRAAINGVASGKWAYNIDGVDAGLGSAERGHDMIAPTPEIIQEVRLTANNDVSEGFTPGVSLSLTEKSGTNEFHGSLYHYMRNDAFGARSFFLPKVPQDIQNNGGFSLGGPLTIPKVYNGKNRTFFFMNLDIYRFRTDLAGVQQAVTGSVATSLMRQGNFSELLGPQIGTDALGRPVLQGQIYDPLTTRTLPSGQIIRDPFPGNIIADPARLSPPSKFFLNSIALPTLPGTALNWTGPNAQTRVDKDQLFLKFDHTINPANRLTYAYERLVPWFLFQDQGVTTGFSGHSFIAGGPGFLGPAVSAAFIDDRDQYRHRFNYVWTPKPNLLMNFRAGLTRTPHRLLSWFPVNGPGATAGRDAGLKGTLDPRHPLVNIEGYSQFGSTFSSFVTPAQNVPVNIDLAWTKGQHNFKFGTNYINVHAKVINQNNGYGTFTFRDRETGLPGFSRTGSGMASYILGEVDNLNLGSPFDSWVASGALGFFGQDTWRVTPKLTLTYGLRWDYFFPTTEHNGKVGSFDPRLPNPGAGGRPGALTVWGEGPGRNGITQLNDPYHGALGGQLGIAYSLDSKTVVRMNYGVGYASGWDKWTNGLTNNLPQPGFSATFTPSTVDEGVTPAFNWNNTIPVTFPQFPVTNPALLNGGTLGFINRRDNKPPMYQNIGFEIGRELPGQLALRASYVATLVHRIAANGAENMNALPLSALSLGNLLLANINSPEARAAGIPIPYPGFNGSVAQALLPFPQYLSTPGLASQVGNSSYHALQLNLQKRFGSGLSFLAAYTASKNLTNAFQAINGAGGVIIQHPSLANTGKAIDAADRPQQLALSWTYDLPFGKGKAFGGQSKGVVNQIIGGWKVSGTQNYFSGRPIRVTSRATIPFANAIWPNSVPGQALGATSCGDYDPGDPARNRYLNINAFSTPAPFTFGNISQLPNLRVCGYMEENFGIDKEFPVSEHARIRFGSLFQNAFNRVNWRTINSDINNPASFGKYQDSYPGRNVQFYLRVDF
jgi:carboxypeptidase family protein